MATPKPPHSATAPRKAILANVPFCTHSLSYILYVNGQKEGTIGAGATEFANDLTDLVRTNTLHMKRRPGFHVYYKHGNFWYGVPEHFDSLASAMPFLQGGNRVLIEYRFTTHAPKYLVCPDFAYTEGGGQREYKSANELIALYDVPEEDCQVQVHPNYPPFDNKLIVLRPLANGDYDLARKRLKHHGVL